MKRAERITKPCANCNKLITRRASRFPGKHVFCSQRCKSDWQRTNLRDKNNPCWRGGRREKDGYIFVRMPDHPRAVGGYVREHILVVEENLGHSLKLGECVHHINGERADNRIENLKVFASGGEHSRSHKGNRQTYCECGRPAKGRGLCTRHLAQLKRTGRTWDFENEYRKSKPGEKGGAWRGHKREPCPCGKPSKTRGLCNAHYQKLMKYGELPEFGIVLNHP